MRGLGNSSITLCILFYLPITISCTGNRIFGISQNEAIEDNSTEEIIFSVDSLSFKLDSVTVNIIHYCQFLSDYKGKNCISFLNENTNSIYFYDIQTKEFLDRIDLRKYGIRSPVQGYLYSDNIVYIYSYSDASLSCIDLDSGQIRFSYAVYNNDFDRRNPFFKPKPFPLTCMPIQSIGDTIILSGLVAGESTLENGANRPVITLFDTVTKEISNIVNYPPVYQSANWGGSLFFRSAYYDTNEKNEIVVSFPASDEIVVYSIREGNYYYHLAGSSSIKKIHPFSMKRNKFGDSSRLLEWYLNNPSYENILYDEYRHCYYRFAKMPQIIAYNSKIGTQKPTSIIVLDESYSYIGEFSLPNNLIFVTSNAFVSREGIYIQKKELNEDLISFYIICPIL